MPELNEKELNEQIEHLDVLLKKIQELHIKKDYSNPDFKALILDFIKNCKPIFTSFLEDARGVKLNIERKNNILNEALSHGDYDFYDKTKEEFADINGSNLEHHISLLEHYFSAIDNGLGLLRENDCLIGHEYFMYSEKLKNYAFVINEIERISFMR